MVIYVKNITIPPNTPKTDPIEEIIELEGEVLDSIEILIPYGVIAVAGVAVFYGKYQLTPKPDGEFITGNGETIKDPIKWELPERKTYLRILAYNESQNYPHTFYLRFIITEKEIAKPASVFEEISTMFKKILRGW